MQCQKQPPAAFSKKAILKSFAIFTQKKTIAEARHNKYYLFLSTRPRLTWLYMYDIINLTILTGKNGVFFNSVKEWLVGCFWPFSYITYRCLKNVIHQIDSKNEWLLVSASFTTKFGLVFVLTLENAFLRGFIFKPTERA